MHLHVQQLLALALGADPDTVCGVASHSQDVEPILERIGAARSAVACCRCGAASSSASAAATSRASSTSRRWARRPTGATASSRSPSSSSCAAPRDARAIEEAVEERGLDHLVIGSCSRRFQGPTFERIARELRLGENAVAFANLREGCSFIHRDEPGGGAEEGREDPRRRPCARAAYQSDLPRSRTFLHRSALVVGGGIAGMSAAEELAEAGIEVHLVERQQSLGGYMARLSKTFPTEDCAMCSLAPRLTNAATDSRIHIHTLSEVTRSPARPASSG